VPLEDQSQLRREHFESAHGGLWSKPVWDDHAANVEVKGKVRGSVVSNGTH
jgi:hypothetical protein